MILSDYVRLTGITAEEVGNELPKEETMDKTIERQQIEIDNLLAEKRCLEEQVSWADTELAKKTIAIQSQEQVMDLLTGIIANKAAADIKIKYFSEDYPRTEKISKGDWIDLRVDSIIKQTCAEMGELEPMEQTLNNKILWYKKGDILKLGLGVAMELPEGYEAIVVPRSSTFKHWGLIQTNSPGVIDNSYCGDNDEWMIEFIAMRDGSINRHDRVCQFRIQENQPDIEFEEVEHLENKDRGSYGSTGRQ